MTYRKTWHKAFGEIPKGYVVHHINGNRQDNRLENLSLMTKQENHMKFDCAGRGYSFNKNMKYRPYIARRTMFGKPRYLGAYGTPCGAIMKSRMAYVNHLQDVHYGFNLISDRITYVVPRERSILRQTKIS